MCLHGFAEFLLDLVPEKNTQNARGLAPRVGLEIAMVPADLKTERGITVLITEQNANFTLTLAEEIYLLETGRIKMKGMPAQLKQEKYIQERVSI